MNRSSHRNTEGARHRRMSELPARNQEIASDRALADAEAKSLLDELIAGVPQEYRYLLYDCWGLDKSTVSRLRDPEFPEKRPHLALLAAGCARCPDAARPVVARLARLCGCGLHETPRGDGAAARGPGTVKAALLMGELFGNFEGTLADCLDERGEQGRELSPHERARLASVLRRIEADAADLCAMLEADHG